MLRQSAGVSGEPLTSFSMASNPGCSYSLASHRRSRRLPAHRRTRCTGLDGRQDPEWPAFSIPRLLRTPPQSDTQTRVFHRSTIAAGLLAERSGCRERSSDAGICSSRLGQLDRPKTISAARCEFRYEWRHRFLTGSVRMGTVKGEDQHWTTRNDLRASHGCSIGLNSPVSLGDADPIPGN